jgi:hypothetical protein
VTFGTEGIVSDIFISYKKEDKDRVSHIVDGLRAEGLKLWWDQDIGPGQSWDETIKQRMENARCIVVVWSSLSVTAPWVKEEAGHGKARGILVPVRIHDVEPPLGFGLIQAADLRYWKGDRDDKNWRDFVGTVGKVVRGEKIAQLFAPQLGRKRTGLIATLAVAGTALAALAIAIFGAPGSVPSKPVTANEQAAWVDAMKTKERRHFEAYLADFPKGRFAEDAKAALASCRKIAEVRSEPFERKFNVQGNTSAEAFGDREWRSACATALRLTKRSRMFRHASNLPCSPCARRWVPRRRHARKVFGRHARATSGSKPSTRSAVDRASASQLSARTFSGALTPETAAAPR